jgi:integrase
MNLKRYSWTEPVLCHYGHNLSKAWFISFTFQDLLTQRVKRIQIRKGINYEKTLDGRLRAASATLKVVKRKLEQGYNPFCDEEVKKMPFHYTVTEAFDHILKIHLPTLEDKTKEHYEGVANAFKQWCTDRGYEGIIISEFPHSIAVKYIDSLIAEKSFALSTHNDHLRILRVLITQMKKRKWTGENPFSSIGYKRVEVGRNIAFTDKEREALSNFLYAHDRSLYYFTQIMYYCFIRRSELSRLRVSSFDVENHTITIPADASKSGRQESVVIPLGLEPILEQMNLKQYDPSDYVFGRGLKTGPEPFPHIYNISTRHNKNLTSLGISREKGLYSWKHSGVVKAYYATGKDVYAILRQLRHRDLNTTQIYLKSLGLIDNSIFRNAMTA